MLRLLKCAFSGSHPDTSSLVDLSSQKTASATEKLTLTLTDLPGEILTNVAHQVIGAKDLQSLILVNRKFRDCVQPLSWTHAQMHFTLRHEQQPDCNGHVPVTLLEYKTNFMRDLPVEKAKFVRALKFEHCDLWSTGAYDFQEALDAFRNIEQLALNVSLSRLRINTSGLRLKSLQLHNECLGPWTTLENRSYDGTKALLLVPTLRYLELVEMRGLGKLLDKIDLRERTLAIQHLKVFACQMSECDAISTIVRACRGLETIHLNAWRTSPQQASPARGQKLSTDPSFNLSLPYTS